MPNSNVPVTAGTGTNIDTYLVGSDHRQYVIPADHGGSTVRFTSNITPGRASTTHNLATLWNGAGAGTLLVDVKFVGVDLYQTVVKAVTVPPPLVRVSRISAIPTGASAGTKVLEDTTLTSNAGVAVMQSASADRTSGTAIGGATVVGGLTQEFAPRLLAIGTTPATNVYEMADRMEFLTQNYVTLRSGEGILVHLIHPAATSDPVTDMWVVSMQWEEYAP